MCTNVPRFSINGKWKCRWISFYMIIMLMKRKKISCNTHNAFIKIFYGKCSTTFVDQCM